MGEPRSIKPKKRLLRFDSRWAFVIAALYTIVLVVGTHLPNDSAVLRTAISLSQGDKSAHFLGYFGLAVLIYGFCRIGRTVRSALLVGLALAIFGAVDEWTQPLFGRSAELTDWLGDVLGIVTGWTTVTAGVYVWNRFGGSQVRDAGDNAELEFAVQDKPIAADETVTS